MLDAEHNSRIKHQESSITVLQSAIVKQENHSCAHATTIIDYGGYGQASWLSLCCSPAAWSTQAQQSTPTGNYTTFLPLVIGGAGTAPVSAVRFVADSQRATHAAIGPEGGTLSAEAADGTRFELLIAPEALDFTETITMTPVLRAENLPLSGGLLGAVSLEPAGLDFYAPAVLRILSPTSASDLLTIGFAYDGDGAQFHLRPIAQPIEGAQPQVAEPLVNAMELTALRPVGMARGTQADIRQQLAQPAPADPQDAMEQQLLLDEKSYAELQLNADYQTLVLSNSPTRGD